MISIFISGGSGDRTICDVDDTQELGVELPESELTGIALNIINSELDMGTSEGRQRRIGRKYCDIHRKQFSDKNQQEKNSTIPDLFHIWNICCEEQKSTGKYQKRI